MRRLALAAFLFLFAGAVLANTSARTIQVGVMISGTADRWKLIGEALREGLREHGYVEGKNLVIHQRTATYPDKRMSDYAAELASKELDVIVIACNWTMKLITAAQKKTPIVMATIADPVASGFVKSIARPGGNVTGMTGHIAGLAPKMLEHLSVAVPTAKTVALLLNDRNRRHDAQVREVIAAGAQMGVKVVPVGLHLLSSVPAAREVFRSNGVEAAIVLPDDDLFWEFLDKIIATADDLKMPTLLPKRELVWAGAFMSFGADSSSIIKRSTNHIVRIVNGAVAGELPIEHPTQVELVLNKTKADRYGLPLPRAAILRAAEVYER